MSPKMIDHASKAARKGTARLSKTISSCIFVSSALAMTSVPALAVEPWIMVEKTTFTGDAITAKQQGVTTDGTNWYFSGTNILERTDKNYNPNLRVAPAIPLALQLPSEFSSMGLNHIGDIDYADGLLYISLDTSKRDPITGGKYDHPVFAVFHASDMSYTGQAFSLNPPHGTHDIASWVAVDAKNGLGYGMAYENATELAVYNLSDWSFKEYIPLTQTISQAQGGKLLDGWMYFSTDNDQKTIYRANLKTGEVENLGNLNIGREQEVEGLSFNQTKDGWSMYILNREALESDPTVEAVGFYRYLRPYGNALSGEIHADINGALVEDSRFARDAANSRIRSAFDAVSAPVLTTASIDTDGAHAAPANADGIVIWSQALAMTGDANGSGDAAAFGRNTAGFIGGADAPVGSWRVGVLGGYSHSRFDVPDRASSGSSDNYNLGLYAGTQMGQFGFRAGAIYGWHDIETRRNVVFPAFSEQLSADYNAATAQAFSELAYRFDIGRNAFEPFANLAYVHLNTDGFAETGGATSALAAQKTTTENTFSTFGVRASTQFDAGTTKTALHGMLGWQHAYGDVDPASNLAFNTGASFAISGVPIARDALAIEAGLDVSLSSNATLGASYSGQIAKDAQGHAFKVSFDLKL
ncbi:autotransporter outer membrane beta-barrel domain-containing protein [Mesorhizobium huakuii]|uniref:Autotransporter domain-containing protein n=1 Tax=Mesorhizobium huakuii TaxID=28104 RepID=A0ABZ0VQE1_9HYPH|nr:autotransporter domain-containing protein [Mesorhizobium huakuii]WQB97801.1 autotransporter domain-containing protein [Mesorhizobium huakuii]